MLSVTPGPLIQVSGDSPFVDQQADAVTAQVGTNFLHSEVEPILAINPTDRQNLVGFWQQDRWSNGGARSNVLGVSVDGGQTWQSVTLPGLSLASEPSADSRYQRASDPWLSFTPDGELFAISLVLSEPSGLAGRPNLTSMVVSKSVDGGLSWTDPTALVRSLLPSVFHDKESMTADPHNPDLAYAIWNVVGGPTKFTRTTDRGETWESVRDILTGRSLGHQIVVADNGELIDTFLDWDDFPRQKYSLIRSSDAGQTWSEPISIGELLHSPSPSGERSFASDNFNPFNPDALLTETGRLNSLRADGLLHDIAIDGVTGNMYAVWTDGRFREPVELDGFGGLGTSVLVDRVAVVFSMSNDGGNTWSEPVQIDRTPVEIALDNQQSFLPSVSVAADGTVGFSYYDFRNNTVDAGLLTDVFLVQCRSDCSDATSWGEEVRLTDTSFDYEQAPVARGPFLGDYQGLVADGNDFLTLFSQPHDDDPASVFFRRVSRDSERLATDLAVSIVNDVSSVLRGRPATYTVSVTNTGTQPVSGADVRAEFASELTRISWTCLATDGSTCTPAGQGDISDTVNLLAGGAAVYTVEATVSTIANDRVSNIARVTAPGGLSDLFVQNNVARDVDPVAVADAFWDGAAPTGIPGDGSSWSDANNWTAGGVLDRVPSDSANIAFDASRRDMIFLTEPTTVSSLDFREDYVISARTGAETLSIRSGNVWVDSGVAATIDSDIVTTNSLTKLGDGTLVLNGSLKSAVIQSGTLQVDGPVAERVEVTGGTMTGTGTLGGLVVNAAGVVSPGGTRSIGNPVGRLDVDTARIGGVLHVDVGADVDLLTAKTVVFLEGSRLELEALESLSSPGDHTVPIINISGTRRDTFSRIPAAVPPKDGNGVGHIGHGVFFSAVRNTESGVTVDLVQAGLGDTDGDIDVDFADFVNLANQFGHTDASWSDGDFDGDGRVGFDDFVALANRFDQ